MVKKNKTVITALDRKVNRPRVTLRRKKNAATLMERKVLTLLFWASDTKTGIDNLNPALLGYNFGTFFSPLGYRLLSPAALKRMKAYLTKFELEDWTR